MKDGSRSRMLNDTPVIGKGLPMLSMSQKPFAIDDVVYSGRAEVKGYYQENRRLELDVISWRVIQLNYKERYVRVRNEHGCEMTISFAEGCARMKLFHDFDALRQRLIEQINEEMDITRQKISERKIFLNQLSDAKRSTKNMNPPSPPVSCKEFETS